MEKFKPRTFNMGFSREVYEKVGGFKDMYGEDIDLSIRIQQAGFVTYNAVFYELFLIFDIIKIKILLIKLKYKS